MSDGAGAGRTANTDHDALDIEEEEEAGGVLFFSGGGEEAEEEEKEGES